MYKEREREREPSHSSTGFPPVFHGARAANNSRHRGDDGRFYFESSFAESLNPRKR